MTVPGVSGGAAAAPANAAPAAAGITLSRDKQVTHICTLLERKGAVAAADIRRRLAFGQGVTAKGITFDSSVLHEALSRWQAQQPATEAAAVPPRNVPAEASSSVKTPTVSPVRKSAGGAAAPVKTPVASPVRKSVGNANRKSAGVNTRGSASVPTPASVPEADVATRGSRRQVESQSQNRGTNRAKARAPEGASKQQKRLPTTADCTDSEGEEAKSPTKAPRLALSPVRASLPGRPSPSLPSSKAQTTRRASVGSAPAPATTPAHFTAHASTGSTAPAPAAAPPATAAAPTPTGPPAAAAPGYTWELRFSPPRRRAPASDETERDRRAEAAFEAEAALGAAARAVGVPSHTADRTSAPAAQARATGSRAAPTPVVPPPSTTTTTTTTPDAKDLSVKELKALLAEQSIDYSGAVEKRDLQALWQRFAGLRERPLEELQKACVAEGGPRLPTVEACARWLAAPPAAAPERAAPNDANQNGGYAAQATEDARIAEQQEQAAKREDAAQVEGDRIFRLRKESYPTPALWGFAVLAPEKRDKASINKAYRGLMKILHPDKVGQSQRLTKALEMVKEAKDLCERNLSTIEVPSPPRLLKSTCVDATRGKRKFKLTWSPPATAGSATAPVKRYVVAAFDPAYGRALTVSVLEPDYSEEKKCFVSVEDLNSYILAEQELQKMPRLWEQPAATIQVAAANEAGQSTWATLSVPLHGDSGAVPTLSAAAARRLGTRKR